jgi:rubrerythrin
MIAQRKPTNKAVVRNDDATVQAAVTLLTRRNPTAISYRWICETCGMIHAGSAPAHCESCGKDVTLARESDLPREMTSRW